MRRSDGGFTLIETLFALVILSIAVVVIAGGMGVSVFASNRHRDQAEAHALLLQAAENVRASAAPLLSCVDHSDAEITAAYLTAARGTPADNADELNVRLPQGWTQASIQVYEIASYNGTGFDVGVCNDNGDPDNLFRLTMQLVTLEVTTPDGRDHERLSFVKVGQP